MDANKLLVSSDAFIPPAPWKSINLRWLLCSLNIIRTSIVGICILIATSMMQFWMFYSYGVQATKQLRIEPLCKMKDG